MSAPSLMKRLEAAENVFGTLVVSESPRWMDALPGCGLDFVFIDTEHIALNRNQLSWMCHGYASKGLPPLVRIPSPDPYAACMVLDGGAAGVVAPYIESVDQVKQLVGATKFRPIKGEKLNRLLAGEALERDLDAYIKHENNQHLLVINIESVEGIENLDAILAVPGLDGVLIGPHDLSCSLGIPEQYDHPDFLTACESIFSKTRFVGLSTGIHFWGTVEQQARFIKLGANLLIHSADILLMQKYLTAELVEIKLAARIQEDPQRSSTDINI